MTMKRRDFLATCAGGGWALATLPALAKPSYPDAPIHMIVPFPPGGGTDIVARTVAAAAAKKLNTSIIVDNRDGAGGTIGTQYVARANPDGYTIGLVSGSHVINPSIYPHLPYNTERDFAPITQLVSAPGILVVTPSLPVKSVQDLIKLAKSEPGKLFFASAGFGTPPHLAGELFKNITGIDVTHVPYKGNAAALTAVMSGLVAFSFPTLPSALPLAESGQLRALGVTSATRSPSAPNIPTIAEAGVPGYDASSWYGLIAPARTPTAIINTLRDAFASVLVDPSVKQVLFHLGLDPVGDTPAQFTQLIDAQIVKWATVVKQNHVRLN